MNVIIEVIQEKANELSKEGDKLLEDLEAFGWKDKRPERTEARREETHMDPLRRIGIVDIPATSRIPRDFIHQYHKWYASCLALIETNMPSRREELTRIHEGAKGAKVNQNAMLDLLRQDHITFSGQIVIARNITQIKAIVGSVPHYLDGRLHDLELAVAQAYVGDQLTEAQVLLKGGYVRAAGAVAGVLLERHLKLLCDRHQPPIKYTKTVGISKLNDLLKDAAVYDVSQWRKVQWMGDVRNSCDHAHTVEPRKEDVADLIAEVKKFVSLFVI
jgi:hypothetical protein